MLITSIATAPKTSQQIPWEAKTAVARIRAIQCRVKQTSDPAEPEAAIAFLVAHLARLNPAVRDMRVFFLFNDLFQAAAFTKALLCALFCRLQAPDILFSHILAPEKAAIFLRSFAVKLLSGKLTADQNRTHILSKKAY